MRYIFFAIVFSFASVFYIDASVLEKNSLELEVGSQPTAILEDPTDNRVHILCNGIDNNFNGIYDEEDGDEKPSWWIYNPDNSSEEAIKVKEFEEYFVKTSPPFFAEFFSKEVLFIGFRRTINSDGDIINPGTFGYYSLDSYEAVDSDSLPFEPTKFKIQLDFELAIVDYFDSTSIALRHKETGIDIVVKMDDNPIDLQMVEQDNGIYLYVLNQGKNGNSPSLIKAKVFPDLVNLEFEEVNPGGVQQPFGESANTLYYNSEGQLYAYKKGANRIFEYDILENSINDINLPDGLLLNQMINQENYILTSESSDFYVMNSLDNSSHSLIEMHRAKGKTNDLLISGDKLYIAVSQKQDDEPGSTVLIYNLINNPASTPYLQSSAFIGYQPMAFFTHDDKNYVICNGVDFNFDGNINENEGEQKPSLWEFEVNNGTAISNVKKLTEFDFNINFPFRAKQLGNRYLAIPSNTSVKIYDFQVKEVVNNYDFKGNVSSAFGTINSVTAGIRSNEGKDKVYTKIDDTDEEFTAEAGKNIGKLEIFLNGNTFIIVALNEGDFGEENSTLDIYESEVTDPTLKHIKEIEVGGLGNHLSFNENNTKLLITMNGSHEVHVFNTSTMEVEKTFSSHTEGFGGPRESYYHNGDIYVTTYSNSIKVLDAESGKLKKEIGVDGHSESIQFHGDMFVTSNINYSNYEPNNRMLLYNSDVTSVENNEVPDDNNYLKVHPNPVFNEFTIASEEISGKNIIQIRDVNGRAVAELSKYADGFISLDSHELGLESGIYFIIVNNNLTAKIAVIR